MANFATITELIEHALFRAGEWTGGALADGDFYNGDDGGPVLGYINDVLEGLILGSPLGLTDETGRPLAAIDWVWARKQPAGILHLEPTISTGTVSIEQGTQTATFSTTLTTGSAIVGSFIVGTGVVGGALDLTGYRLRIGNSNFLPRISSSIESGGVTVATIDEPWPDEDVVAGSYKLFKLEYNLATDFVRFNGEPTLSVDPWTFPVMAASTLNDSWPISGTQEGTPRAAALIAPQTIRLSHSPTSLQRVEYEYIYMPDKFTLSTTDLILPPHQRRCLAVGAAYYICFDKSDSKAGDLRGEFLALYSAMASEFNRHQRKMSKNAGRILYRLGQVRGLRSDGPLRTASGLIIGP